MEPEFKVLVEQCAKGDRHAQRELYDLFAGKMYVVCLRYALSDQEAEDMLQESFIKIFKNIKNFRGDSRLGYWIKRIVINTALNQRRNKLYMYPMVDVEEMRHQLDYDQILSDYSYEDLLKMIAELPTGSRIVFNMYAIDGYSHKEIAEKLGISIGTSKSQYSRAKTLLQKKISEEESKNYEKIKR